LLNILAVSIQWHRLAKPAPIQGDRPAIKDTIQTNTVLSATSQKTATRLDRARELIRKLRDSATKIKDVQALCMENAITLDELRALGGDAIPAFLDEIADKTCPASLRMLLIESVAHLSGHNDPHFDQVLMAIITDSTDDKNVRMRALRWIPETGSQPDGAKLLAMLPTQTDADLEFGIVRALRGFKVAGSDDVLAGELSDDKSHLIRIAAYHALASQGEEAALNVLQQSVAARLANGSQESQAQENAVAVHGVLALGELPNSSSLPLLESVTKNPSNSVSVRSTAFDSIAAIGGKDALQVLRRALSNETDQSVLVYVARALSSQGDASDAQACLQKAATVSDSYTKSELQRAAHTIQQRK
jgi:hypothetical protein